MIYYRNTGASLTYSLAYVQGEARVKLKELLDLQKIHIFQTVLKSFDDEILYRMSKWFSKPYKNTTFYINPSDFNSDMDCFEKLPERYKNTLLQCKSMSYMFSISNFTTDLAKYSYSIHQLRQILSLKEQPTEQEITLPIETATLLFS